MGTPLVTRLSQDLVNNDVSHKVGDSSGSIGKRYARTDEIAIPFGITVDFDSLKEPHTVTLRERDTTTQIRIGVEEVATVVRQLATGKTTWTDVLQKFPKFEAQETKSSDDVQCVDQAGEVQLIFDVKTRAGLETLNTHLEHHSYIEGYEYSPADLVH